jgi:hypothetical protein
LKEERSLKVFENKVLKRISGYKGAEMRGSWRKLRDEAVQ